MYNSNLTETKTLVFSIFSLSEDMKKLCTKCSEYTRASLPIFSYFHIFPGKHYYPYNKHYTVAWKYEFYFLVLKTTFYSLAALARKILLSPLKNKIHIFAPPCNILYIWINSWPVVTAVTLRWFWVRCGWSNISFRVKCIDCLKIQKACVSLLGDIRLLLFAPYSVGHVCSTSSSLNPLLGSNSWAFIFKFIFLFFFSLCCFPFFSKIW